MSWDFTFKGIAPSTKYCRLATIPVITPSEIKRDRFDVPGRNGELLGADTYRSNAHVTMTIHCMEGWMSGMSHPIEYYMNMIRSWLSGSGELVIKSGTSSEAKYIFEVLQVKIVSESYKNTDYGRLEVDFEVYPYNFLSDAHTSRTDSTYTLTVSNPADVSLPLIVVTGVGNGTLTVNGNTMTYSGIGLGNLKIDVRRQIAYQDYNNTKTNKSNDVNGDYAGLVLKNGTNTLTLSNTAHIVAVYPLWGYFI